MSTADPRTSKGYLQSSGRVMEEAPVSGGHEDRPPVPMGEQGLAGRCPLQRGGSSHFLTATVIGGFLNEC